MNTRIQEELESPAGQIHMCRSSLLLATAGGAPAGGGLVADLWGGGNSCLTPDRGGGRKGPLWKPLSPVWLRNQRPGGEEPQLRLMVDSRVTRER